MSTKIDKRIVKYRVQKPEDEAQGRGRRCAGRRR